MEEMIKQFKRTINGKATEPSPERDARDKARSTKLLTPDEIQNLLLTPAQVHDWLLMLGPVPERPKFSSKSNPIRLSTTSTKFLTKEYVFRTSGGEYPALLR